MSPEQRTCLVTGTSGYLGSRVAAAFVRRGWRVVSLTRTPAAGSNAIPFQLGSDVPAQALAGAHALVHCAYDFTGRSWPDIHRVNVAGSQALLRAAREANIPQVIYISTISAFDGCHSLYGRAKLEIERSAHSLGATIVRPGLIWGDAPRAMFGSLVDQVRRATRLPLIGGGTQIQYLVHDDDLTGLICRRAEGTLVPSHGPITVAHEQPWTFRQILEEIARARGKRLTFVPIPWRLVWSALKAAELAGLEPQFRSDSLVSLMYQNPAPDFEPLRTLDVRLRPFHLEPVTASSR